MTTVHVVMSQNTILNILIVLYLTQVLGAPSWSVASIFYLFTREA